MVGKLAEDLLEDSGCYVAYYQERKNEIPYIEGKTKDIGARVGYTVL